MHYGLLLYPLALYPHKSIHTLISADTMSWLPDDREGAVREVAKVYELIKTHQPLFRPHHHGQQEPPPTTEMAQRLLSEALRALNIALSTMTMMQKQQEISGSTPNSPLAVKPEPQLSSPEPADSKGGTTTSTSARSGKRRRYLSIVSEFTQLSSCRAPSSKLIRLLTDPSLF